MRRRRNPESMVPGPARHSGESRPAPRGFFVIERVAGIALCVSLGACAGMLVVLFVLSEELGTSYAQIVVAHNLALGNLAPALLVLGLAMVVFAGIVTWLLSLYSSFRIAGPLYRFARNLDLEIDLPTALPMAIRHTDQLQHEWHAVRASVLALREHYDELRAGANRIEQALCAGPTPPTAGLQQAVSRFQELERRVQL